MAMTLRPKFFIHSSQRDMRDLCCLGLFALLLACSQVISQNLLTMRSGLEPSTVLKEDAEQLFVEAMKLAETGDRAEANKRLDGACQLWIKGGNSEQPARARLQMGDLYRNGKQFEASLTQYRLILQIGDLSTSLKAATYNSIGEVYDQLYQADLSLPNYSKALQLARAHNDYLAEAQVLLNLASLSFKKGDISRAVELAQSAVNSSHQAKDQTETARCLGFLAQMQLKSGLLEKGHRNLDRALSLYREINDLPAQINLNCFLSGVSLSDGQLALARDQAESALKMTEDLVRVATSTPQKLRNNALRWPCWLALARAQRASGQRDEALKSYFWAVSGTVLDWWLVYAVTEKSAIGFAEERQAAYRELVDLLVELGKVEEAYNAYQYARVRTLSGLIRSRPISLSRANDPDGKMSALSSIIALRKQLLSPILNRPEREALERELSELELALAERRFQAELSDPKRRLAFSRPASLKRLQDSLPDDEFVSEFCVGNDRSFVWLISRRTIGFEILPGRRELEGKVRDYLNVLSTAPPNLQLQSRLVEQQAIAKELFTTLFGKLRNQLPVDSKLIVIPDGLLNYVPFESLIHNDRYLIEDHEISYLPSASLIELMQGPPRVALARVGQLDLLAFGDPAFPQSSKPSITRKFSPRSSAIGETLDWDTINLAPLPRTRDEVESIASLIPKERRQLYLGKDSTEKAFKQETLKKYRWIHLATHSLINERNPDRSAVVLLGGKEDEDGFLRVTEIEDLNLDSDLVTLSGCETGRGQLLSGEGIIGLSRSFLIAGSRSVIASQWAVSDISTAQLMKDFYQQLVGNVAKPAALREAKLRMLHSSLETRHPYYWAPFVIIGVP